MWIFIYFLMFAVGIMFPRLMYFFAVPFLGLVTGGFFWGVLGLAGWIPGTAQSFGQCVLAGCIPWAIVLFRSSFV